MARILDHVVINSSLPRMSESSILETQLQGLLNTLYYLFMVPIALPGNVLTVIVVAYLIRHRASRRQSIPDLCVGFQACVDLCSLLCVHSLTLVAMAMKTWPYPQEACVFQAFASNTYLKVQFLVQVCISADRYLAVVHPLRYHRFSSLRIIKCTLAGTVFLAVSTTLPAILTSPEQVTRLPSWYLCLFDWSLRGWGNCVVVAINSLVYLSGLVLFIICNGSLVRILWHYHARNADSLLNEITQAMRAVNKTRSYQSLIANRSVALATVDDEKGQNAIISNSAQTSIPMINKRGMSKHHSSAEQPDQNSSRPTHGTDSINKGVKRGIIDRQLSSASVNQVNFNLPSYQHPESLMTALGGTHVKGDDVNGNLPPPPEADEPQMFHSMCAVGDLTDTQVLESPCAEVNQRSIDVPQLMCSIDRDEIRCYGTCGSKSSMDNRCSKASTHKTGPDGANLLDSHHEQYATSNEITHKSRQTDEAKTRRNPPPYNKSVSLIEPPKRKPTGVDPLTKAQSLLSCNTHRKDRHKRNSHTRKKVLMHKEKHDVTKDDVPPRLKAKTSENNITRLISHETGSNMSAFQLNLSKFFRKIQRKAKKQKREILLARLVLLCAVVFVATWIPYMVVLCIRVVSDRVSHMVENIALKLVFVHALLNPIFYGLCRKNYRKGYRYTSRLILHYFFCGLVDAPTEDKVFFESRQRRAKRFVEGAQLLRRRKQSMQALNILQQTLQVQPNSPLTDKTKDFQPSAQLQALFERCMVESDSETGGSSSVDYEALIDDEDELVLNLQRVWSMCLTIGDGTTPGHFNLSSESDDDIDLDVDYDAMIAKDGVEDDNVFLGINPDVQTRSASQMERITSDKSATRPRLAASTPDFRVGDRHKLPSP